MKMKFFSIEEQTTVMVFSNGKQASSAMHMDMHVLWLQDDAHNSLEYGMAEYSPIEDMPSVNGPGR